MSNVITLQGPNPTQQIVSQFLDQFNANRRADQQNALGRDELAQRTQAQTDTNSYQQGTLKDAQDKFALVKQQYNDQQLTAEAKQYIDRMSSYHDAIQSLQPNDPQRAALEAQAKAEAASIPPQLLPYVKIATLEPILTPQRQEQLSTQGVKTGAAQGVQGGNPTPMQADVFSKENFKQGMSGPMVQDIQSMQPQAAAPPAGQAPSPTTEYYRGPALGLDTTAAQDQTAQTQITDTKLQGQAQRDVAGINAKSALAVAGVKAGQPQAPSDPAVVNGVAAVKGAVAKGLDPNVVLNRLKPNKKVYDAVVAELTKPENAATIESQVNPAQVTAIKEIDPIIEQAKKVAAAYAPYKNQNGLTDRDTLTYGLYMAGQKPPDDSPASQLANLQMLRVQAGARLLKGGSRAYPALQMAMQHAGNGLTDTRAQIFSKTMTLLEQLQRVRDSNAGTLGSGTTDTSNPLGLAPPPGAH